MLLHAPLFAETGAQCAMLKEMAAVKEVFDLARNANVAQSPAEVLHVTVVPLTGGVVRGLSETAGVTIAVSRVEDATSACSRSTSRW